MTKKSIVITDAKGRPSEWSWEETGELMLALILHEETVRRNAEKAA